MNSTVKCLNVISVPLFKWNTTTWARSGGSSSFSIENALFWYFLFRTKVAGKLKGVGAEISLVSEADKNRKNPTSK